MSLPLVYPPVISPSGDVWIDGGILDNFPIMNFQDMHTVLGFDFVYHTKKDCKYDTLSSFITRVIQVKQAPMDVLAWNVMPTELKKRCIIIDTGETETIPTQGFTAEQRLRLLEAGSKAARKKIEEFNCKKLEVYSYKMHEHIQLPSFMKKFI
jgi:predicted acylesterase/phospholipase RssA